MEEFGRRLFVCALVFMVIYLSLLPSLSANDRLRKFGRPNLQSRKHGRSMRSAENSFQFFPPLQAEFDFHEVMMAVNHPEQILPSITSQPLPKPVTTHVSFEQLSHFVRPLHGNLLDTSGEDDIYYTDAYDYQQQNYQYDNYDYNYSPASQSDGFYQEKTSEDEFGGIDMKMAKVLADGFLFAHTLSNEIRDSDASITRLQPGTLEQGMHFFQEMKKLTSAEDFFTGIQSQISHFYKEPRTQAEILNFQTGLQTQITHFSNMALVLKSSPVKTQSINQPVQSTNLPVLQTAPSQFINQPVQSANQPLQSTKQPVQSINQPVQSINQPGQSINQPVQSTNQATPSQQIYQVIPINFDLPSQSTDRPSKSPSPHVPFEPVTESPARNLAAVSPTFVDDSDRKSIVDDFIDSVLRFSEPVTRGKQLFESQPSVSPQDVVSRPRNSKALYKTEIVDRFIDSIIPDVDDPESPQQFESLGQSKSIYSQKSQSKVKYNPYGITTRRPVVITLPSEIPLYEYYGQSYESSPNLDHENDISETTKNNHINYKDFDDLENNVQQKFDYIPLADESPGSDVHNANEKPTFNIEKESTNLNSEEANIDEFLDAFLDSFLSTSQITKVVPQSDDKPLMKTLMMSLKSEFMLKKTVQPQEMNVVAVNFDEASEDAHDEDVERVLQQNILEVSSGKVMVTDEFMKTNFANYPKKKPVPISKKNKVKESTVFLPISNLPKKKKGPTSKPNYKVIVINPFKGGIDKLLVKGEENERRSKLKIKDNLEGDINVATETTKNVEVEDINNDNEDTEEKVSEAITASTTESTAERKELTSEKAVESEEIEIEHSDDSKEVLLETPASESMDDKKEANMFKRLRPSRPEFIFPEFVNPVSSTVPSPTTTPQRTISPILQEKTSVVKPKIETTLKPVTSSTTQSTIKSIIDTTSKPLLIRIPILRTESSITTTTEKSTTPKLTKSSTSFVTSTFSGSTTSTSPDTSLTTTTQLTPIISSTLSTTSFSTSTSTTTPPPPPTTTATESTTSKLPIWRPQTRPLLPFFTLSDDVSSVKPDDSENASSEEESTTEVSTGNTNEIPESEFDLIGEMTTTRPELVETSTKRRNLFKENRYSFVNNELDIINTNLYVESTEPTVTTLIPEQISSTTEDSTYVNITSDNIPSTQAELLEASKLLLTKLTMLTVGEKGLDKIPHLLQEVFAGFGLEVVTTTTATTTISTTRTTTSTVSPSTLRTRNFKHNSLSQFYRNRGNSRSEGTVSTVDDDVRLGLLASLRNQIISSALQNRRIVAKANNVPVYAPARKVARKKVKVFYEETEEQTSKPELNEKLQQELAAELNNTLKSHLLTLRTKVEYKQKQEKEYKDSVVNSVKAQLENFAAMLKAKSGTPVQSSDTAESGNPVGGDFASALEAQLRSFYGNL